MRSMGDPDYSYTAWTPERRAAASRAGRERWARRRNEGITADTFLSKVEALHAAMAKARADEDAAQNEMMAMLCASQWIQMMFPDRHDELEAAYARMAATMNW